MSQVVSWKPVMDLSKEGLEMFFKPYQLAVLEALWATDEALNSRQCWEAIEKDKSRASVINFLEAATNEGLLDRHHITGKGGHRGMYRPMYDRAGTIALLVKKFKVRLDSLLIKDVF